MLLAKVVSLFGYGAYITFNVNHLTVKRVSTYNICCIFVLQDFVISICEVSVTFICEK